MRPHDGAPRYHVDSDQTSLMLARGVTEFIVPSGHGHAWHTCLTLAGRMTALAASKHDTAKHGATPYSALPAQAAWTAHHP